MDTEYGHREGSGIRKGLGVVPTESGREKARRNMADEGVGKIFFPRKKKKPPDERTVTVETADET